MKTAIILALALLLSGCASFRPFADPHSEWNQYTKDQDYRRNY